MPLKSNFQLGLGMQEERNYVAAALPASMLLAMEQKEKREEKSSIWINSQSLTSIDCALEFEPSGLIVEVYLLSSCVHMNNTGFFLKGLCRVVSLTSILLTYVLTIEIHNLHSPNPQTI